MQTACLQCMQNMKFACPSHVLQVTARPRHLKRKLNDSLAHFVLSVKGGSANLSLQNATNIAIRDC